MYYLYCERGKKAEDREILSITVKEYWYIVGGCSNIYLKNVKLLLKQTVLQIDATLIKEKKKANKPPRGSTI